ncbi:unnamed protein product [Pleuronectes platessa]|uniref:Uncharacterized protein n=1 Tax=Pleuronectes platessa TaxID=8262 RepID=A0A9N7VBX0_PLEPL|nr:unnamed protein product [Pleuronectes platessa]
MSNHELYEPLQSSFRPHHSTERALIKITNDILIAADSGSSETLTHAFITSRLDYCNGVLSSVPDNILNRLQYVGLNRPVSQSGNMFPQICKQKASRIDLIVLYTLSGPES